MKQFQSVDWMYGPRNSIMKMVNDKSWFPEMSETESAFLCGLLKEYKPRKIVEVGVAAGGTTAIVMQCIAELELDSEMFSIDYSVQFYRNTKKRTGYIAEEIKQQIEDKYDCHLQHRFLLGKILPAFMEEIGDGVDFVILDTMHILPGELLDFLTILPYMNKRSVVCLHDISLNQITERQNIATNVLFNSVAADKILNYLPEKSRYGWEYPNIAAFQINEDTKKYIGNIFGALTLNWTYVPDRSELNLYRTSYSSYGTEMLRLFDNAVLFNQPHEQYLFPHEKIKDGSRVFLYGAGNVGQAYYRQIVKDRSVKLVAWVDNSYENFKEKEYECEITSPNEIEKVFFDFAVIAIWTDDIAMSVKIWMIEKGIPESKIIWVK